MDIQALINEKIKEFEDLKKQMAEISKKIGVLQEEGQAFHLKAIEVSGAAKALIDLQNKEAEALAKSKTASLILPEGVKPIVESVVAPTPAAPVVATVEPAPAEAPKTDPIKLEVQ